MRAHPKAGTWMRCHCCGLIKFCREPATAGSGDDDDGGNDGDTDDDASRAYLVDFRCLEIVVERTVHVGIDSRFQRFIEVCTSCSADSMRVSHYLLHVWTQGRAAVAAELAGGASPSPTGARTWRPPTEIVEAVAQLPHLSPRIRAPMKSRAMQVQLASPRQHRRLTV